MTGEVGGNRNKKLLEGHAAMTERSLERTCCLVSGIRSRTASYLNLSLHAWRK